ncbi:uncharacterized protein [Trachinotus anak]|uniref:uncharacterized protein isoform X2 n=1 Tax=Trachinotus anak TaxID=443729 RepID=UPI0039F24F2B
MLLGFFLLFFFCESTVTFLTTNRPNFTSLSIPSTTVTEMLSPLQAVATPDYPVAAGQTVNLHCSAFTMPKYVNWSWQHLENLTWQHVGSGRDLTLTQPKQSGLYRCCAKTWFLQHVSRNLTVYIIAMQPTGFPGPEKAPKGDFQQTESDGDVYMNYTSTNQAYTNLDPTNMTGDNVYSSLS